MLELAGKPATLPELMVPSGRTNRTKFRDQVVAPLLEAGLLKMTIVGSAVGVGVERKHLYRPRSTVCRGIEGAHEKRRESLGERRRELRSDYRSDPHPLWATLT